MDDPKFIVPNQKEESIFIQRVNINRYINFFSRTKTMIIYFEVFECWVILHDFLPSADFFQLLFLQNILSGIASEYQKAWTQIRLNIILHSVAKIISRCHNLLLAGIELNIDEFSDKNFESDEKTTLLQGILTLSLLMTIHFNFCGLLMSSADNLYKQFGPRSGLTFCQA